MSAARQPARRKFTNRGSGRHRASSRFKEATESGYALSDLTLV
jgi:hypothetical protein